MSRTSFALSESWKDYAGIWNAAVEPWIAPLGVSKCHAPRLAQIPPLEDATVPAGEKLEYNFRLPPGSVILGVCQVPAEGLFAMQLTDVGMGHALFQEPADPATAFSHDGSIYGFVGDFCLFPCPWPVTGEGEFTLEAWNNNRDSAVVFFLQLLVAEVTSCPVR